MKYDTGDQVCLGDTIQLWKDATGVVVCSFDTDEYSRGFSKNEWGYLGTGVLIDSKEAGLLHLREPEPGMRLISRA